MADLIGSEVVSVRGEKIGKIDQLFVHGAERSRTGRASSSACSGCIPR